MSEKIFISFSKYLTETEYAPGKTYKESTIRDYIKRIKRNISNYDLQTAKSTVDTLTNKDDRSAIKCFIKFLEQA